jgi:hypothetical protein
LRLNNINWDNNYLEDTNNNLVDFNRLAYNQSVINNSYQAFNNSQVSVSSNYQAFSNNLFSNNQAFINNLVFSNNLISLSGNNLTHRNSNLVMQRTTLDNNNLVLDKVD